MASLGWVSPGAATEGVTPIFFLKKNWRPFLLITAYHCHFYWFYSGVIPSPWRVSPHIFFTCPTSCVHYSLQTCSQKNFFLRYHPLEAVTLGGPLPRPPSYATAYQQSHGGLLLFLQCFDTVGWVIWPVKTRPHMTYNVFGGTSSLTQSINRWIFLSGMLTSALTAVGLG